MRTFTPSAGLPVACLPCARCAAQHFERFRDLEDVALETLLRLAVCFDMQVRVSALQNLQEVVFKSSADNADRVYLIYTRMRGYSRVATSSIDKGKLGMILEASKVGYSS